MFVFIQFMMWHGFSQGDSMVALVGLQWQVASHGAMYGMLLTIALCAVHVGRAELLARRSNAQTLLGSSSPLVGARAGDGHT